MGHLHDDLAEYTKRPAALVEARCKSAAVELAWQWHDRKDDLSFYRDTDLYLFDLTNYQHALWTHGVHDWLKRTIKAHKWKTILDYGGGIGEWSIIAAKCGCEVEYLEVWGSKTAEYAHWRFNRTFLPSGHPILVSLSSERFPLSRSYDAIICMDVLEHLREPDSLVKDFATRTEWLFANPNEVQFNWLVPQHVSKYKLEPAWEHIEAYLWRRAKKREVEEEMAFIDMGALRGVAQVLPSVA